ncbi:MAG: hypothetical protein GX660_04820, partial [Clostridiaceae bacterium]|nr:hypothetical protein [Clostridiaceae bacterium]
MYLKNVLIAFLMFIFCSKNANTFKSAQEYFLQAQEEYSTHSKLMLLDSVLLVDSNFTGAYLEKGNVYRKEKKFDSALLFINQAIDKDPGNAYAY